MKFVLVALTLSFAVNGQQLSPAAARVAAAEKRLATNAKSWEPYNDLAFALCRVARDSDDLAVYQKAGSLLQKSLELSPGNYDARKLTVTVLLGEHEFKRARELAIELNHKVPDDIGGWALLVDVSVAFGDYKEAERAAQWILDLRAGSTLGFVKAAGLREIFGDPEGSAEFYKEAEKRTARSDLDEQAWLLTQHARESLLQGKPEDAEELLKRAMALFPDSQLALAGLAAVRTWQGRYSEAAALLEQRYRKQASPANLYDWAAALERCGSKPEAETAFRDFERSALPASDRTYNWNQQLIYFYCDHKHDPAKGLLIAEREVALRQDWITREALGWALYRSGRYSDAAGEMAKISEVGVGNPDHLCHALQIAEKTNNPSAAEKLQQQLVAVGGSTCDAAYGSRPIQASR